MYNELDMYCVGYSGHDVYNEQSLDRPAPQVYCQICVQCVSLVIEDGNIPVSLFETLRNHQRILRDITFSENKRVSHYF